MNEIQMKVIQLGFLALALVASCHAGSPLVTSFPPGRVPATEVRQVNSEGPESQWRIPEDLIPTEYKIQLRPVFPGSNISTDVEWEVHGNVEITMLCQNPTNQIHLHAFELTNILDNDNIFVSDTQSSDDSIEIISKTVNETQDPETIIFTLETSLARGKTYTIYIDSYKGKIADYKGISGRMNGMYRTTYEEDNVVTTIVSTHFSRTRGFRKLVPSFDDPKYKANFTISIARESNYSSLSNMNRKGDPEEIGEDLPGWFYDHYETTPIMPPTVLAMVVYKNGELVPELGTPKPPLEFDKPVNVWGPPKTIADDHANFSAEAVASLLAYYDRYFGIPYELPKMDSLGVTHFSSGAMENWGLNIYRSSYMFNHHEHGTAAQKFSTGAVIAHELAHQWWGNLVTHQWWNDWWLTEGFATYFSYEAFGVVYGEYASKVRGITDEHQDALEFDITNASKPVHGTFEDTYEQNPSEIDYSKGSSLVRMMSAFLTEPVFLTAVKYYLNKERYKAVTQDVLFADIQESLEDGQEPSNGVSIATIMEGWTKTTAYPLVRVSKSATTPNLVYFSQERFKAREEPEPESAGDSWYIPIMIVTKTVPDFNNRTPDLWLNKGSSLASHTVKNTDDWIIVNPEARGYYRVLYDDHYARLLQFQLKYYMDSVPEATRSQLIDDYLSAAFELYIRFDEADKMVEFISRDGMLGSWISYLRHFRRAYNLVRTNIVDVPDEFGQLKDYILPKVTGGLEKIGEPGDSDLIQTEILRSQLMDWACAMGDDNCVVYADNIFADWVTNTEQEPPLGNPIPVELRSVVYCRAAAADGSTDGISHWEFLREQYTNTQDKQLLNALSCSTNDTKLGPLVAEAEDSDDKEVFWSLFAMLAGSTSFTRGTILTTLNADLPFYVTEKGYEIEGLVDVFNAITPLVHEDAELVVIEELVYNTEYDALFTDSVRSSLYSSVAKMRSNKAWLPKFRTRFLEKFPVPPAS